MPKAAAINQSSAATIAMVQVIAIGSDSVGLSFFYSPYCWGAVGYMYHGHAREYAIVIIREKCDGRSSSF